MKIFIFLLIVEVFGTQNDDSEQQPMLHRNTSTHKFMLKIIENQNGHRRDLKGAMYIPVYHTAVKTYVWDDDEKNHWPDLIQHFLLVKFNPANNFSNSHSSNYTTTWIAINYSPRGNFTYHVSKSGGGVNVVVQ